MLSWRHSKPSVAWSRSIGMIPNGRDTFAFDGWSAARSGQDGFLSRARALAPLLGAQSSASVFETSRPVPVSFRACLCTSSQGALPLFSRSWTSWLTAHQSR